MAFFIDESWILNSFKKQYRFTGTKELSTSGGRSFFSAKIIGVVDFDISTGLRTVIADKRHSIFTYIPARVYKKVLHDIFCDVSDLRGSFIKLDKFFFDFCVSKNRFYLVVENFIYYGGESDDLFSHTNINNLSIVKNFMLSNLFLPFNYEEDFLKKNIQRHNVNIDKPCYMLNTQMIESIGKESVNVQSTQKEQGSSFDDFVFDESFSEFILTQNSFFECNNLLESEISLSFDENEIKSVLSIDEATNLFTGSLDVYGQSLSYKNENSQVFNYTLMISPKQDDEENKNLSSVESLDNKHNLSISSSFISNVSSKFQDIVVTISAGFFSFLKKVFSMVYLNDLNFEKSKGYECNDSYEGYIVSNYISRRKINLFKKSLKKLKKIDSKSKYYHGIFYNKSRRDNLTDLYKIYHNTLKNDQYVNDKFTKSIITYQIKILHSLKIFLKCSKFKEGSMLHLNLSNKTARYNPFFNNTDNPNDSKPLIPFSKKICTESRNVNRCIYSILKEISSMFPQQKSLNIDENLRYMICKLFENMRICRVAYCAWNNLKQYSSIDASADFFSYITENLLIKNFHIFSHNFYSEIKFSVITVFLLRYMYYMTHTKGLEYCKTDTADIYFKFLTNNGKKEKFRFFKFVNIQRCKKMKYIRLKNYIERDDFDNLPFKEYLYVNHNFLNFLRKLNMKFFLDGFEKFNIFSETKKNEIELHRGPCLNLRHLTGHKRIRLFLFMMLKMFYRSCNKKVLTIGAKRLLKTLLLRGLQTFLNSQSKYGFMTDDLDFYDYVYVKNFVEYFIGTYIENCNKLEEKRKHLSTFKKDNPALRNYKGCPQPYFTQNFVPKYSCLPIFDEQNHISFPQQKSFKIDEISSQNFEGDSNLTFDEQFSEDAYESVPASISNLNRFTSFYTLSEIEEMFCRFISRPTISPLYTARSKKPYLKINQLQHIYKSYGLSKIKSLDCNEYDDEFSDYYRSKRYKHRVFNPSEESEYSRFIKKM